MIPKYNRALQRAIVVLGFVFLFIALITILPHRNTSSSEHLTPADSILISKVKSFEQALQDRQTYDSIRQSKWEKERKYHYDSIRQARYGYTDKQIQPPESFPFDPNTLDSSSFIRLGLRPHMAHSIIRYRSKGGRFFKPEDLLKIYHIDTIRIRQLIPHIIIKDTISTSLTTPTVSVNINTADSTDLQSLPYVASARARQIIAYRKRLGGYTRASQIAEACTNISTEHLSKIIPHIFIDTTSINKIYVNRASVEWLKRHPYINFYQAKAIYELRWELGGTLTNIEQLKQIPQLTPADIKRLTPYLDFSQNNP